MEWCQFHTAVQVFKVKHKLCPSYLREWFINVEVYTGCSGRNKHCLFIPQVNITLRKMDIFLWSSDLE